MGDPYVVRMPAVGTRSFTAWGKPWSGPIVVPGVPQVAGGPYAYLRHPNYVAVVLELAGIALASGARVSGPLVTLGFGALMIKRIFVEDRALGRARAGS